MCGICGQFNFDSSRPASQQTLRAMLDKMSHRGPDDEGIFCDGPAGLAMRRLSIIDITGGHQPIFNEDRSCVIVFNGEIYNYVELRAELLKRGHRFATNSDTEVIIHLYEEKGERCVEDLNGMFAFAIYDQRNNKLILARDRIGIKPLHYTITGGSLLFASEIPCLLATGMVDKELDRKAIDDYLTYFYIPGTQSVYKSIRKLGPAQTMVSQGGKATTRTYWKLQYNNDGKPQPLAEYVQQYREKLKHSVQLQLRSDVPLGVFLSGGLDSGSVVAAIAKTTGQPCQSFTIGFDDPSYDESAYAAATAQMYGTKHHHFRITPNDMIESGRLIGYFGEPFGPFTIVQGYAISKYSREHIKVALAGDGGDELFGGYQTYIASRVANKYLALPGAVRKAITSLTKLLPVRENLLSWDFRIREFVRGAEMFRQGGNLAWKIIFDQVQKQALLSADFRSSVAGHDAFEYAREIQDRPAGASLLQRCMYSDLAMFLPDCVLTQTDRMSMAASQEVRVPLLDHELVEFAATVPDKYKLAGSQTKILLREAMKGWLPQSVLSKPKTGFTTPIPIWIRRELKDYVMDILSPAALAGTGIFEPTYVQRLLDEHNSSRADHGRRIWSLVNFMLWYKSK